MPSRLTGRVEKLEKRLRIGEPAEMVVIVKASETMQEAIARTKKQNPNTKYDLIFIIDLYSNLKNPSIDSEIKAEEQRIRELQRENKAIDGTQEKAASA
jgi:hypothetical protein